MIPLFKPYMAHDIMEYLAPVLTYDHDRNMHIGEGAKSEKLEQEFKELCKLPHLPLAVNSGTSALEVALFLAGVGPGSKCIVTSITCSATIAAIRSHYAIPIWADVNPVTGLTDPYSVERNLYKHPESKAIVGVNWGGKMPDYKILKSFGLPVIEDAAHGPYATGNERGDYVAWSMQAIKFLTTGDGGMLFTPEDKYDDGRLYRWFGLDRKSSADFRCAQNIKVAGTKKHLNDIAAAIGLANIQYTNQLVEAHQRNARYLQNELADTIRTTTLPFDETASYWIYTIHVDNPFIFTQFMKQKGIHVSPVHRRCDLHDAYNYPNGPLPGTEAFDKYQVSIPNGWWLTRHELELVAQAVKEYDQWN